MRVSDLINWDVRRAQFTLVVHQPTLMYFLKNKNIFIGRGEYFLNVCAYQRIEEKCIMWRLPCGESHLGQMIIVTARR